MKLTVNGTEYEVIRQFNENRALVNYEGLAVLVDRDPQSGTWDLSGQPANPDEEQVIKDFQAPMNDKTVLDIEKD